MKLSFSQKKHFRDFQLVELRPGTGTAQMILDQKVNSTVALRKVHSSCSGVWRQYDGEMILWSPWFWDQINDGTASNCAIIALGKDKNAGQWADEPCTNVRHYICERDQ